jgi:hypothetical protein
VLGLVLKNSPRLDWVVVVLAVDVVVAAAGFARDDEGFVVLPALAGSGWQ